MCEMLGSEPVLEEIPFDRNDLSLDTQLVFNIYDKLPARWEGFSGQYLGKDLSLLPMLFDQFNVDRATKYYIWEIIPFIDNLVAEDIAKKVKAKSKLKEEMPSG